MIEKDTKIPKDPEKITRIMINALDEFAHHGYRGTKTANIADKAAVSKGIIFRYYGDKAHLYLATVKYATDHIMAVADYRVWQDSQDLGEMIANATKYKIQLQLKYPEEFKVLLDAYAEVGDAPAPLKHEIAQFYAQQTSGNIKALIAPVLDRLAIRDDVSRESIQNLMMGMMTQIGAETKAFMQKHPQASLTDFDTIIKHAKQYVTILEHGFLKKS